MRRSRHLYSPSDWIKEILGWLLIIAISSVLLPVLGFVLRLCWAGFKIGWDLIK